MNALSLIFYGPSSLKQQAAGRHVTLLGHIILILSQPDSYSEKQQMQTLNLRFDRSGLEPKVYRPQARRGR
jgi:hypothetical protein